MNPRVTEEVRTLTGKATLGVVAGGGMLPERVLAACHERGRAVHLIAVAEHADPRLTDGVAHAWIGRGEIGRAIRLLRDAQVEEVLMVGDVGRPGLHEFDVAIQGATSAMGDDGLVRLVVATFEREGLRVVSLDGILDDLAGGEGAWGRVAPDERALVDIARGLEVAGALGALDVGHAVVVQDGIVLGIEAAEGTDALIRRCAALRRPGPGGVLLKISKVGQERRVDAPVIGPETVRSCIETGLRGLALEAEAVMVVDRESVVSMADAAGLFVCGVRPHRNALTPNPPLRGRGD